MKKKTAILIVDDSLIFRKAVEESLANENDIEVIGSVRNGIKALEFIEKRRPDLITLDVEMPELDGLETLAIIQELNAKTPDIFPMGVVMVSAFTHKGADITIKALENGAFDFITKPEGKIFDANKDILRRQLVAKIRYFASRMIASKKKNSDQGVTIPTHPKLLQKPQPVTIIEKKNQTIKALFIGVSTGGPRALVSMLPQLCEVTTLPIFIVQHMPPKFTESLAASLDTKCRYTVVEASENDIIQDKFVYIAPGGKHMLLRRRGNDIVVVINEQPPEQGCRPSVDVLFRSAVPVYDGDVIAIILTGMGCDGTKGIRALKRSGAYVIAQDEESSVVWGMPGSAVRSGNVDEIISLNNIPNAIEKILAKE